MRPIVILLTAALLYLCGCTYGYEITTSITRISENQYEISETLPEIYFDDNNQQFTGRYDQIAFIEIQGRYGSTTSELIDQIKIEGAKVGADAIIQIQHYYISRESGELLSELLNPEINSSNVYDTRAITGIAIKFY
jgi:hypothetical protein